MDHTAPRDIIQPESYESIFVPNEPWSCEGTGISSSEVVCFAFHFLSHLLALFSCIFVADHFFYKKGVFNYNGFYEYRQKVVDT
jgi:hypothetical protein